MRPSEAAAALWQPETSTLNSFWWDATRPDQRKSAFDLAVSVPATAAIGDHGPEYQFQPSTPADHEAILNCGCTLFFPVPTMDGELLWCSRHDDYFKSRRVVREKPKAEPAHFVKCNSCPWEKGPIESGHMYTSAKRHAFGKSGHRRNDPHEVLLGKRTESGITWKKYEEKK